MTTVLLILVALSVGWPQIILRFESLITPELQLFGLAAYAALLGICLVGIFSAAFIPVAPVRWGFALFISLSGIMVETYQSSVEDHMPYDAFISMIDASGSLHEAWGQYASAMMIGGVQAVLGEQRVPLAVVDKVVRQAQVEHRKGKLQSDIQPDCETGHAPEYRGNHAPADRIVIIFSGISGRFQYAATDSGIVRLADRHKQRDQGSRHDDPHVNGKAPIDGHHHCHECQKHEHQPSAGLHQ